MRHFLIPLLAGLAALLVSASPEIAAAEPESSIEPFRLRASTWLGTVLSDNDGLAPGLDGLPGHATTAYAILGLTQAGFGAGQIQASAQALADAGDAFVGTPDQVGEKSTAISLLMLATAAANIDLTEYATESGPRDLNAELRSVIHDDGQIGDFPSVYGQAFAILALSQTPDAVPDHVVSWLLNQPCADKTSEGYGGYGFTPGSCTDVDPDNTALAIRALITADVEHWVDDARPAVDYLVKVQDPSGGYASALASVNTNSTGLAAWALGSYIGEVDDDAPSRALQRAQNYLLTMAFGCTLRTGTSPGEPTELTGAIAYDTSAHAAATQDGLTPSTTASLVSSTAQAMLGLGNWTTNLPTISIGVAADLPSISCGSMDEETQAAVPAPPRQTDNWLYAIGGFVVVIGVFLAWRFVLAQRRA